MFLLSHGLPPTASFQKMYQGSLLKGSTVADIRDLGPLSYEGQVGMKI